MRSAISSRSASAFYRAAVLLKPPRDMSLEAALEYIESDEYVEITPAVIRLRKIHLTEQERKRHQRGG